ncbi:hypothetical protein MtrunA17_Chr1g0164991 [Medicago truncatula]|uniref:Transmembrane protein n=1 Tax=Medicago truncatula TaxID=3880 RepID=A0A396JLY8_MEDTR|nr:hypothetical protein MtrunA17_Chr1g0164991 [Medicago truncatula]
MYHDSVSLAVQHRWLEFVFLVVIDRSRGDVCLRMIYYGFDEFFVVLVCGGSWWFSCGVDIGFFVVVLVVVFYGDARGGCGSFGGGAGFCAGACSVLVLVTMLLVSSQFI